MVSHLGGICVSPNRRQILVCDREKHRILIYDKDGNLISFFGNRGANQGQFVYPMGICVWRSTIFITDSGNNRIQIFDSQYRYLSSVMTGNISPEKICVFQGGNILISTSSSNRILLLDPSGLFLKDLSDQDGMVIQFGSKFGFCTNAKNQIIVVTHHRIYTFTSHGNFLLVTKADGMFLDEPEGVCVDRHDNIIISDSGNCAIVIISPKGVPIQAIKTYSFPRAICIRRRKIITSNCNYSISIFSH